MITNVNDPFDLDRFVAAQANDYDQAFAELRAGRKRTHWIWYILPQFQGLGSSRMSRTYAIGSLAEAQAYLAHPILGPRLEACVVAMNSLSAESAVDVLGEIDAAKFRSCATLFAEAAGSNSVFTAALDKYFQGQPDRKTLSLLSAGTDE